MKTILDGSILWERAEDGTQSLQFAGRKNEDGEVVFVVGSIPTIVSMVTHADWFFTREFARRARITIESID